jgi:hypothetical protein
MKSAPSESGNVATDAASGALSQQLLTILQWIRPALPPVLINEEGYNRLAEVASLLPVELSNFWGFECRLGQKTALADILFEVKRETPGIALLAGETPSVLDQLCDTWPGWNNLRILAQCWLNDLHLFRNHLRNIWLEFDLAEALSQEALQKASRNPNFFFGPESHSSPREILAVTAEIMHLHRRSVPDISVLRWFLETMPIDAKLFQIGLMLTRVDDCGLRLCVNKISPEAIIPWLAMILPEGEAEALTPILAELLPMSQYFALDFNLTGKGVDAAIGFECYQDWLQDDPGQWLELLNYLTRRGLCLPEKGQGVRDYTGITASPLCDRLAGNLIYLHTFRKIHHVKCTLHQGRITQAKAYLAVSRPCLPLADVLPSTVAAMQQVNHAW